METADVVIAGAGPTGLMLAIELCRGGVTPLVLERRAQISEIPKGNGLFGLVVRALDYRGLLDTLREGSTYAGPVPGFGFGPLRLDFSRLDASPLHVLAMPQRRLEERLTERLRELGGSVTRGHTLTGLRQDEAGVTVEVSGPAGGYQLQARYLVGCDGAHSAVRQLAGIGFPGVTSDEVHRIGRVIVPESAIESGTGALVLPSGQRLAPFENVRTAAGAYSIAPMASLDSSAPSGAYIVSMREEGGGAQAAHAEGPMTLGELRASVRRVIGADLPMSDPIWLSRLTGESRVAERYIDGRVLLAGDAAHLYGTGGTLNGGLLDAINLGWKLAAHLSGRASDGHGHGDGHGDSLLATYHAERHAAAQRTLMQTRAQKALSAGGEYARAAADLLGELLAYDEPARHVGELIEGSDLRYDIHGSPPHPLLGTFAPDLRLSVAGRPARVAELVRSATAPVLLDLTPDGRVAASAERQASGVPFMVAQPLDPAPPADALLIRPDGYIAWAGGLGAGLGQALRTWLA